MQVDIKVIKHSERSGGALNVKKLQKDILKSFHTSWNKIL
jgi:hypothetical protein